MNPPTPEPANSKGTGEFYSPDWLIIIDDQPGDNTIRPASPEVLKWANVERERLRKLGFNLDGTRIEPPETDAE